MNNFETAKNKLSSIIEKSGDDGINLLDLCEKMGWKEHGVKSLCGSLIKDGIVVKHATISHYFWNNFRKEHEVKSMDQIDNEMNERLYKPRNVVYNDPINVPYTVMGIGDAGILQSLRRKLWNNF